MLSAVNVEATFRGPWRKAAFFAFLGVFLGLVVKTLSEAAAIARTSGIRAREALRIYTSRLEFPVIVILAAIAGTFVYVVQYLHDPDWGAEGTDTLRLFATCFIVQMGSSEALSVVSRVTGGFPAPPATPSGG
jgi:H+/Cl- antiporter ClcA